jgi:voltage-gated potassium channel
MGRLICHDFDKQKIPFVIIDHDAGLLAEVGFEHGLPLHGDATSDAVLEHAGVARAKALVTVLPKDADNLYITLSARVMNAKLTIIARAEEPGAEAKLRKVGADLVVAPYVIGGQRVAQAVLQPHVSDLIENVVRNEAVDYILEEVRVETGSSLCGKTLAESRLHEELGIVVLSIKRSDQRGHVLNPQSKSLIQAGDVMIVVGHREPIEMMKQRMRKSGG